MRLKALTQNWFYIKRDDSVDDSFVINGFAISAFCIADSERNLFEIRNMKNIDSRMPSMITLLMVYEGVDGTDV